MDQPQIGYLAKVYCGKELPLQVIRPNTTSPFYIGTWDSEEGPFSRESVEYFPTRAVADEALATGRWTQRLQP